MLVERWPVVLTSLLFCLLQRRSQGFDQVPTPDRVTVLVTGPGRKGELGGPCQDGARKLTPCLDSNAECMNGSFLPRWTELPRASSHCFCKPDFLAGLLLVDWLGLRAPICFVPEGKACQSGFLSSRLHPAILLTSPALLEMDLAKKRRTVGQSTDPYLEWFLANQIQRIEEALQKGATEGMIGRPEESWSCWTGRCDPGTRKCAAGNNSYVFKGELYTPRTTLAPRTTTYPYVSLARVGSRGNPVLLALTTLTPLLVQSSPRAHLALE